MSKQLHVKNAEQQDIFGPEEKEVLSQARPARGKTAAAAFRSKRAGNEVLAADEWGHACEQSTLLIKLHVLPGWAFFPPTVLCDCDICFNCTGNSSTGAKAGKQTHVLEHSKARQERLARFQKAGSRRRRRLLTQPIGGTASRSGLVLGFFR